MFLIFLLIVLRVVRVSIWCCCLVNVCCIVLCFLFSVVMWVLSFWVIVEYFLLSMFICLLLSYFNLIVCYCCNSLVCCSDISWKLFLLWSVFNFVNIMWVLVLIFVGIFIVKCLFLRWVVSCVCVLFFVCFSSGFVSWWLMISLISCNCSFLWFFLKVLLIRFGFVKCFNNLIWIWIFFFVNVSFLRVFIGV